jgi:tRNA threonylcarbamoyladenosine biosynthesis protein TsaE
MRRHLRSEADTLALGARLAQRLSPGCIVFLEGALGVGKTTLVRGLLRALGHAGPVKSPTFTLVEPYELNGWRIYHLDLYRLTSPDELEYLGVRDYLDGQGVCLVEWPERGAGVLPEADLVIELSYVEGQGRRARLQACGPRGRLCLE